MASASVSSMHMPLLFRVPDRIADNMLPEGGTYYAEMRKDFSGSKSIKSHHLLLLMISCLLHQHLLLQAAAQDLRLSSTLYLRSLYGTVFQTTKLKMRFTVTTLITALQLAGASRLPRSDAVEYSTLEGVEAFNTTFAKAHLVNFEEPVLEYDAMSSSSSGLSTRAPTGNVYVCINAGFQPACTLLHWTNDVCGKF